MLTKMLAMFFNLAMMDCLSRMRILFDALVVTEGQGTYRYLGAHPLANGYVNITWLTAGKINLKCFPADGRIT